MEQIMSSVRHYYMDIVAPLVITVRAGQQEPVRYIAPLNTFDFLAGAGLAMLFLIQKVAFSIFYLIAALLNCYRDQNVNNFLFESLSEVVAYTIAIPIGYVGAVVPCLINPYVLHIPSNGLRVPYPLRAPDGG